MCAVEVVGFILLLHLSLLAPAAEHSRKMPLHARAALFENGGAAWQRASALVMQGVTRQETGSADYLDAHWLARCHNLITEEEANRPPEQR